MKLFDKAGDRLPRVSRKTKMSKINIFTPLILIFMAQMKPQKISNSYLISLNQTWVLIFSPKPRICPKMLKLWSIFFSAVIMTQGLCYPFLEISHKVLSKYKGQNYPCSKFGTFFRLKIKTPQIDHFTPFWILTPLLNRKIDDWHLKSMLPRQCDSNGIMIVWYLTDRINIKQAFTVAIRLKVSTNDIPAVLATIGIEFEGRLYCGIYDSKNCSMCLSIYVIQKTFLDSRANSDNRRINNHGNTNKIISNYEKNHNFWNINRKICHMC